jgi:hypothetical protein
MPASSLDATIPKNKAITSDIGVPRTLEVKKTIATGMHTGTVQYMDDEHVRVAWDDGQIGLFEIGSPTRVAER